MSIQVKTKLTGVPLPVSPSAMGAAAAKEARATTIAEMKAEVFIVMVG